MPVVVLNIPELGLNVFEYIGVPSNLRSNFVLFALLPSNPSYVDKNTSCDTLPYVNFGGVYQNHFVYRIFDYMTVPQQQM